METTKIKFTAADICSYCANGFCPISFKIGSGYEVYPDFIHRIEDGKCAEQNDEFKFFLNNVDNLRQNVLFGVVTSKKELLRLCDKIAEFGEIEIKLP